VDERRRGGSWWRAWAVLLAIATVVGCSGGTPPPPPDDDGGPEDSVGQMRVVEPDPSRIHPVGTDVVFEVDGAGLGADLAGIHLFRNGESVCRSRPRRWSAIG
jgi:hypothetical protein